MVGAIAWWVTDANHVFAGWFNVDRPEQAITGGQVAALMGGVILAAAFGFIDDRWQVRARWQLIEQLILEIGRAHV